ncbi:transposase [Paenibacillus albidus]|uniref:transposase n=1 Tax=Paenibacillus albidus TaxID=2041023 RepID=UPI001BEA9CD2|nr:transposase [Paenibacillus albidus]MBT2291193.1 transposase [Paenibacillus albidus]
MDLMLKWHPKEERVKPLVNELYQRYPQGFYVNAEQRMKDARGAAKYIGRYLARPAIAEYRVVSYDEDHRTGKRVDVVSPVMKFIYDLVQHIPPKHFRMVGRYGLYSRRKNKESQKVINLWRFMVHEQIEMTFPAEERKKKSYRQRMLESYGRDPMLCPCCKQRMLLVVIWHAEYGRIYYYDEEREYANQRKWGMRRDGESTRTRERTG